MGERIGVFGGTFNPIHLGHLHVAGEIQRLFSLSQVHFVVAGSPPHKGQDRVIPFAHRYAMVALATAGTESFIPSMIELEPEASPFSIDTMAKMARRTGPDDKLYFIAGGDSFSEVKTWKESEALLTSYNFVFASRPGTGPLDPRGSLPGKAAELVVDLTGRAAASVRQSAGAQDAAPRIYVVDVGAPDISATRIRQLCSLGKPIERMVPESVREYIRKLHLYGGR